MTPGKRDDYHQRIADAMVEAVRLEGWQGNTDWLTKYSRHAPQGYWGMVLKILNERGVERPRGGSFQNDVHLTSYILKKDLETDKQINREDIYGRVIAQLQQKDTKENIVRPDRLDTSEQPDRIVRLEEVIRHALDRIERLERKDKHEDAPDLSDLADKSDPPDIPDDVDEPKFPRSGAVPIHKLNANVTEVIWKGIEAERRRQKGQLGRAIQILLWRGLGRPNLLGEKD